MKIFWEIGLQAVEILTLIFGILGMTFSLLLLYSPAAVKNLSGVFNRSLNLDRKLAFLDKSVRTEQLFYSHPFVVGACLVAGSLFALVFFFFKLDIVQFSRIVFGAPRTTVGVEMLFEFLVLIGKTACVIGLCLGVVLLVAPQRLRRFESKMNSWFETGPLLERLEKPRDNFDTFLFRHPVFFGALGAAVSCLLIILSVLNLLR
jgi:hypothetical protein